MKRYMLYIALMLSGFCTGNAWGNVGYPAMWHRAWKFALEAQTTLPLNNFSPSHISLILQPTMQPTIDLGSELTSNLYCGGMILIIILASALRHLY